MRNLYTKISLFIVIALFLSACNTTKRVPNGKKLLTKNEIIVDNVKENKELITNQLYQKTNSSILGYKLRLNIYNLASKNPDSTFQSKFINNKKRNERLTKLLSKKQINRLGQSFWYSGIHHFLKKTGESPVIVDVKYIEKSIVRLQNYYFNQGYFNVKAKYEIVNISDKKAKVKYIVSRGKPFVLDTISTLIESFQLDSLYKKSKSQSFLKKNEKYNKEKLDEEKTRITSLFRNNGAFDFQQNYIKYKLDTINTNQKLNAIINIKNQSIRSDDSTVVKPFKLYKVNKVNVYVDYNPNKETAKNIDTVSYNNFTFYSVNKLKYKPKSVANAIFINNGSLFSDNKTALTSRYISNLRVFNYPYIQYNINPKDSLLNTLTADIYLSSRKKFGFSNDASITHSNIQNFGISGSTALAARNIFNGAETLEFAIRGNVGSSKDLANPKDIFFNVSEYGFDLKLYIPRFLFPYKADYIIPKSMIPTTNLSVGFTKQNNIGLDKENFTSTMAFNWTPKKNTSARFDLFNIQYVKNLNIENYFNVYQSSYDALNSIAQNSDYLINKSYFDTNHNLIIQRGTNGFINDVLTGNTNIDQSSTDYNSIKSIEERKARLTANNLIFSSAFVYTKTTKKEMSDNNFYVFRTKLESAGNFLSLVAAASKQLKSQDGGNTILGVEFSQYLKSELEYIKHWEISSKKVFALRSFLGIAIPYGNSKNIPFSKSYFGGGSNDNRAWQPYKLGPGSTGATNDFNEANLKLAFSTEYRFNFFGPFNGALFIDAGNIWNVLNDISNEKAVFSSLKSIKNTAIGSGFGLRYDFNFFVVRLDTGFKTYNPGGPEAKKWFRDYNFAHSVLNIGINYPF